MIQRYTLGESTTVAAIGDHESACVIVSGPGGARLAMHLHASVAAALAQELRNTLPAAPGVSRRPAAPRANWRAIVARLRIGKPIPGDAERVADLLSYLGVSTA